MIVVGGFLSVLRVTFAAGLLLQALGAGGVAVAGFWALGAGATFGEGFTSALHPSVGVDPLSGLFLGTLGLIAAPALVFSVRYLRPTGVGRSVAALMAVFLCTLALVLCARDPFLFLLGWESMTLIPAIVILVACGADSGSRQTARWALASLRLSSTRCSTGTVCNGVDAGERLGCPNQCGRV